MLCGGNLKKEIHAKFIIDSMDTDVALYQDL